MASVDRVESSNPGIVDVHGSPHHNIGIINQDAMDCDSRGQHQQLLQEQHSPSPLQHNTLSLSLPGFLHQNSSRSLKLYNPITPIGPPQCDEKPGRDDCWSEGATFVLIEAWGDRYIEFNRGNLKQKHWKDVADAVNGTEDLKNPKTDVQCKNRLDTLKKKYKLEKPKVAASGSSKWIFFDKLDELIGTSRKQGKKAVRSEQKLRKYEDAKEDDGDYEPMTFHNVNTNTKSKESPDMTDSCPHPETSGTEVKMMKKRKLCNSPFKELAQAIIKFAEVYERIESSKQQQLMDLEKQRMEFTKDLELQRMQLFMQTQVEIAKMKQSKQRSTERYI